MGKIYSNSALKIKCFLLELDTARSLCRWNEGRPVFPTGIELQVTNRCNQSCLYCYDYYNHRQKTEEKDGLKDDDFREIADRALGGGSRFWFISGGGEPMLRRGLVSSLVKKIKQNRDCIGYMSTNMTLFEDSDIENFVQSRWEILDIKFNNSSALVNDEIIGLPGALAKFGHNLRLFKKFKKNLGSAFPKINLGIFLHNRNYLDFPEAIRFAISLGVDRIDIYPFTIHHSAGKGLAMDSRQEIKARSIIKDEMGIIKRRGIGHNFTDFVRHKFPFSIECANKDTRNVLGEENVRLCRPGYLSSSVCFKPWSNITIFADGSYGPCCMVSFKDKIKNGEIEKSWFGDFFSDFRRKIVQFGAVDTCNVCQYGLRLQDHKIAGAYRALNAFMMKPANLFMGSKLLEK